MGRASRPRTSSSTRLELDLFDLVCNLDGRETKLGLFQSCRFWTLVRVVKLMSLQIQGNENYREGIFNEITLNYATRSNYFTRPAQPRAPR